MKNLNIILVILGVLFMSSCSEDDKIIYNPESVVSPIVASPSADDMMFTQDAANEMVMFSWSLADVGFKAATNYDVEFSYDNTFTEPIILVSTDTLVVEVKVSDINSILISLGATPSENEKVYVRIKGTISDKVEPIYSAISEYDVVAYETVISYPMIYVPGAYQGWSPGAENGRLYSYNFDNIYEGIIRITETVENNGQFKLTEGPNWDVNWGGTLTADGDNYTGTIGGGDNFVATPGTYEIKVDLDANTIILTKTDYWGIIGDAAAGWGDTDDVIMHYNGQSKAWEATTILKVGGFKFRKNSSWGGDLTGDANGNLSASGDNIAVATAGSYDVVFDLINMKYSFTLAE